MKETATC